MSRHQTPATDRSTSERRISGNQDESLLAGLFFLSGGAALLYQMAWQRMLFAIFGVDLESVTVIVSVFMFGLGIGALVGGSIADRWSTRLLAIFAATELAIGCFGVLSPWLLDLLDQQVAGSSRLSAAAASFAVLALPTTLMGATLPLLVTHSSRANPHIGEAVGRLYFANTAGAALGAYAFGYRLLFHLDLNQVILLAAGINAAVASLALIGLRAKR